MAARRAFLTGITGQDGSFLAEILLAKGYDVIGLIRGPLSAPLRCAEHLRDRVTLVQGDLLDAARLRDTVAQVRPDELYHLAAPSYVPDSWKRPALTVAAITGATATLLEAVAERRPDVRMFVASSSEMFGESGVSPQREDSPCRPQSPYATAKLAAHQLVGQLRARHGIFATSGILYNHESERRPESFVSRKISRAAAAIKLGQADEVRLGDVTAVRDWSFARDVMEGAWLMLQQPQPDDYILSSGIPHTVAQLAQIAFAHVGLDAESHVRTEPALVRAGEGTLKVGDCTRAREQLGWRPTLGFEQLVGRMVDADLATLTLRG